MDAADRLRAEAEHLLLVRRHDDAADRVAEALARRPRDAELLILAARIALGRGDLDGALAAATDATAIEPSATALHVAALVHRQRESWDAARAAIDDALVLVPGDARLHATRSLVIAGPYVPDPPVTHDGHPPLGQAAEAARRSVDLDPEAPRGRYALAVVAMAERDLPAAVAHLEAALALDPDWVDAHRLLGQVRLRQGMGRLASKHFADAGRLDPADGRSLDDLRRLSRRERATVAGAVPLAVLVSIALAPAGPVAVVACFVLAMLVAAGFVLVRRRRPPTVDLARLAPDVRPIIEADLRLQGDL